MDVSANSTDRARKSKGLSVINLPGTKTRGKCQSHQKNPSITLEVKALKWDWKRGRAYPRQPNNSSQCAHDEQGKRRLEHFSHPSQPGEKQRQGKQDGVIEQQPYQPYLAG